jgi:putative tricarboxylic transport membrane protein
MTRRDMMSGVVLAGIGIFVILHGRSLNYMDEFGPGPGFLPRWLGLLLTGLALGLIISSVRRPRAEHSPDAGTVPGRALLAACGLVATVASLRTLGFIASFALLSFFLVYAVERRSLARAIAVTAGLALGFFLLFRVILPVPLPTGLWGL